MGAKNRWSQGWTWRGNPTCPDTSIYKDHILFSMLRDDSSTTSGLLTRNCGSLIAIAHAPDVPRRASWKIVHSSRYSKAVPWTLSTWNRGNASQ
ncbi:hypothetical protein RU639_005673 [Aspergillus parasiticus]